MEGIKVNTYLNTNQDKFVNQIQGTFQVKRGFRINKSDAIARLIDWAIKNDLKIEDIIQ